MMLSNHGDMVFAVVSMLNLVLYSYFRSSSSHRVRIALNLKGLSHEMVYVDLKSKANRETSFFEVNPLYMVPVLEHNGQRFGQSVAILEYLEETFSDSLALMPKDPLQRAKVRQLVEICNSAVQPLHNNSVMAKIDIEKRDEWIQHFFKLGFTAFEALLRETATDDYCVGDQITLADVCLVPQYYAALRFNVDLAPYPLMKGIFDRLELIPAFAEASPFRQQDCPEDLKNHRMLLAFHCLTLIDFFRKLFYLNTDTTAICYRKKWKFLKCP